MHHLHQNFTVQKHKSSVKRTVKLILLKDLHKKTAVKENSSPLFFY